MATDLEVMTLRLEASATKFERDMAKAAGAVQKASALMQAQSRAATQKIEQNFSGLGVGVAALATRTMPLLAAAFSAKEFIDSIATFTRIQNSLKIAGISGAELSTTFDAIYASAQRNGVALDSLVKLYSRVAQLQKGLGANAQTVAKFTDGVAVALRVAGTSSTEASGALLQLSQLLGAGTVRLEEFNSVNEGARPILEAVANGLKEAGGSVATLRKLVEAGKVSSTAFFQAFLAGLPSIQAKLKDATDTTDNALTRMQNAFIKAAGAIDEATKASSAIIYVLDLVTAGAEKAGSAFAKFGEIAGRPFKNPGNIPIPTSDALGNPLPDYTQPSSATPSASYTDMRFFNVFEQNFSKSVSDALKEGLTRAAADKATYDAFEAARNKAFQTNTSKVSLAEFTPPPDTAAWQKAVDAQLKSNAALQAEAATLSKTTAEREKARLVTELEISAKEKNIPLTGEYRQQIDQLASAYGRLKAEVAFGNAIVSTRDRIRDLQQEVNLVGLSAGEQERVKVAQQLTNEALKAGIALTDARRAQITALADQAGVAATRLEAVNKAQQMLDSMRSELGSVTGSFFNDLANGVKTVDALRNAFTSLRTAVLNALGNQLIAALLGAPGTGLGGGLIGGLFGRAGGGAVNAGQPYRVGESGPEMFVPQSAGRIVPNGAGSTRMGDINIYAPNASGPELMALRAQVIALQRSMQKMAAAPGKQARNMAV